MNSRRLIHGRVELALRKLRDGLAVGHRPLLLLHELGGRSPDHTPPDVAGWSGPIWALDFTGHGDSTVPAGGGYTAEILMADADAALAELGEATVVGRGLGAYVAMLIAGARPALVKGSVLDDGAGIEGGGQEGGLMTYRADFEDTGAPDPFALHELSNDARPAGYAQLFARQAVHLSGVADPIVVAARARPPWLTGVISHRGVVEDTVSGALTRFAGV
jgi:pimeloyl-ACP methyl ester carboxylesterase